MNIYDCYGRGCPMMKPDENKEFNSDLYAKLPVYDWLSDIPMIQDNNIIEIRFKNTRKGYFLNSNKLRLNKNEIVAVEGNPGHDIGIVSLTGDLALLQLRKYNIDPATAELKKVYRKAKPADIEKWFSAIELEHPTMIKTREIAENLNLNMKLGDVEYQGDKTKAIFYYIADDRVDFRELIKVLAEEFKIRIEMKQIGARQEAGRIGGIGPCGRELCCSTWITNFISVTTNAARYQEVSLNPQKLAGQCSKLKCCLNYELPCYMDALEDFPSSEIKLETRDGIYYCIKRDIYRRLMFFSQETSSTVNLIPLTVEKVKEYINVNKNGKKIEALDAYVTEKEPIESFDYQNVVGEESLTRFDERSHDKKRKNIIYKK